jgi:putative heme-binding domain-containing protein
MQGTLYVADPDDVLPAEPAEPVRKFVKDWTTAELAADADKLHGRSVERGMQLFHVAGCIKCHAIGGHGEKLGPDLTDVSKRFRGAKLLEQVLDPSSEINKQYRAVVVVTTEGNSITGLVVKEEPNAIQLLANPLKPAEVTTIDKSSIDEMTASPISTMPKGLLMTFEKDEILDLLAFIESGGNMHHHGK